MDAVTKKSKVKKEGALLDQSLAQIDPEVQRLIELEDERQIRKIILIASESMSPKAVREALQSSFTHLYAEGYPSTRMIRSKEIGRAHV